MELPVRHPPSTGGPGDVAAVRVWAADVAAVPPAAACWTDDERARASSLVEPARSRFLAGRSLLRTAVAERLGICPRRLPLGTTSGGRPVLLAPCPAIPFSVAHSGDLVVVAVARVPVGIDVELRRVVPTAAERCRWLTRWGLPAAVAEAPEPERSRRLLAWWTRREAVAKSLGLGLVGLAARVPPPTGESRRVTGFRPAPGYVGAVALAGWGPAPVPSIVVVDPAAGPSRCPGCGVPHRPSPAARTAAAAAGRAAAR